MAALISAEIGAPISFAKHVHRSRLPLTVMSAFCGSGADYPWQEVRPGFYGKRHSRSSSSRSGSSPRSCRGTCRSSSPSAKVVPALLAGCTVVLKPAPESVAGRPTVRRIWSAEAELPPGVLNVVPGDRDVGEQLVGHAGVDKVSFTGSTAAGREVAIACAAGLEAGQPRTRRQVGGHRARRRGPGRVAKAIQMASLANSGQVCNALSRVLVPAAARGRIRRRTGGRDGVDAGRRPVRSQHRDRAAGGSAPAGAGPRLHRVGQRAKVRDWCSGAGRCPTGVDTRLVRAADAVRRRDNDMRIAREEIFGPVLTVIPYGDEDEAVGIANDTEYGLAGSVFTADTNRGFGDRDARSVRHVRRQPGLHHGSRGAVRRRQEQRLWSRTRGRGHRQLHGEPVDFGCRAGLVGSSACRRLRPATAAVTVWPVPPKFGVQPARRTVPALRRWDSARSWVRGTSASIRGGSPRWHR